MKGKLIHRGNGDYKLYVNESTYAKSAPNPHSKLSKQNCDEIFGVVDVWSAGLEIELDKLPYTKHLDDGQYNDGQVAGFELGAEWGFNKAMELNKDKVFTLEDMYDAVMLGVCFEDSGIQGISTYEELKELAIKRASKPTEIEVEIEMDILNEYDQPKLDSDGCLILTKKINL